MDSPHERLGKTLLGKWRLDALLGEGGMASVYAATHRNGSRGAVKILHSSEAAEVSRFIREGYIANFVDHPAVVRALDDDIAEDGTPFLVLELLEGRALDQLAAERGGRLSTVEVIAVMGEVLDALESAHEHGIVHRDIKPENIFITADGRVKVLDFGIAFLPEGSGPPSPKTLSGFVMGTPTFMSPEQARARWELVGPASDIWSVGATMFTLLSGQFVHEEGTVPELLAATFTKPARSLRKVLPDAPPAVVSLVDRALRHRIPDRWSSAHEMRRALLELEASLEIGATPGDATPLSSLLARRSSRPVERASRSDPPGRTSAPSSVSFTLPSGTRWRVGRKAAALAGVDVALGFVMLVLSARSVGRARTLTDTNPGVAVAATLASRADVSELRLGEPLAREPTSPAETLAPPPAPSTRIALAPPSPKVLAAPSRPTEPAPPVPSSSSPAAGRTEGAPRPQSIYDRRY